MRLHIEGPNHKGFHKNIQITGSKSESNRLLLLQALYPQISIKNLSNSDDAQVMAKGVAVTKGDVDIHHAGTAMRFLTGYFASQEGKSVTLTGSARMTERPIKLLVDALHVLGADISYVANEGYPPLRIHGKKLKKNLVSLPANVSSQYISSLLLIAPSLENGLEIDLVGKVTSVPYIKMTLALLNEIGVETQFQGNRIKVWPQRDIAPKQITVESDWSSASYYYSIVALSDVGAQITLTSYKKNSLQGDSILAEVYEKMGVQTYYTEDAICLKKVGYQAQGTLELGLANAPDTAQTIAVTCLGLGMGCHLTGLHTLPIKETDRLAAMQTELQKFGASVTITHESLTLEATNGLAAGITVDTYNDHRMAMAFAPLALRVPLFINDAGVVSKSYPDFWKDMEEVGFSTKTV